MPGAQLNVHLFRDSFNTPWGFRLQGGKDLNQPLTIQRVFSNSPAEGELQRGDVILSINSRDASNLTHKQAQDLIKHGGGQVQLIVERPPPGAHFGPLSAPIITNKPRAPSLQQPTNVCNAAGFGYQNKGYAQPPAQKFDYQHDKSSMLNRVQTSLDSITLSPRTPEVHMSSPFFQPYQQSYQQPQQIYTPTGLLLEQQRLQQQQHEDETIAPVWERRKQFQQVPAQNPSTRNMTKMPHQKFAKPQTGYGGYSDLGTDYSYSSNKQPSAVWHPPTQTKPVSPSAQAAPLATYTPMGMQYKPRPTTTPKSYPPSQAPVQATPPPWQRREEEDTGAPAWGNTLRSSGVKPWDMDTNYTVQNEPTRSVPYNSAPSKSHISAGPHSPTGAQQDGSSMNGPKVVHLQYNSPMHLYSNQNVAETLKGQAQALTGQTNRLPPPTVNESGERDWSQSAVLRFITQEDSRKSKQPPPVAPKPQYSPVQAPMGNQPFSPQVEASEF